MLKMGVRQSKKTFFTTTAVMSAVDRATLRVLSRFGAFVQRRATSSMRRPRGKKPESRISPKGQPPYKQTGLLARFLYFGYDRGRQSVVIGPVRLNQVRGGGLVPRVLEDGGTSTRIVQDASGQRRERINVKARPYMGPALEAELPGLPEMWRNSVR